MNEFLRAVQPALITLVLAILSGCALVATTYFQSLAAKLKEAKDRDALHMALTTGARLGELKYPADAGASTDFAVDYARKSVPDAIGNLVADSPKGQEVLRKLALSKVIKAPVNGA